MQKFDGKVVWLTGASSGIGAAIARELGAAGAVLAISARNQGKLDELAASLSCTVKVYPGDVTSAEKMKEIAESIKKDLGDVDYLIANAGTYVQSQVLNFDSGEYKSLMNVNYYGMLHCIDAVLPRMLERRAGVIAATASVVGYRGFPYSAGYGASKSAMITFLESLRFHVRRKGVQVSIICPGFVKTPLTDKNNFSMPFIISSEEAAKEIVEGLAKGKNEIHFPKKLSIPLKILRALPFALYDRIVRRSLKK